MIKTIIILVLLPFIVHSQREQILLQDYHFLGVDNEIRTLRQSNDTLYELKCYSNRPCLSKPSSHYKIISFTETPGLIILKLEQLDTISLTTNPYPATRYSVLALKDVDKNQLGYLPLESGLTKSQADTIRTNTQLVKNNFFFTFLSDKYINELSLSKKITTQAEVKEIITLINSNAFKPLLERYKKTKTRDLYAAGLSGELITQACIKTGYNPIGAGEIMNRLMK